MSLPRTVAVLGYGTVGQPLIAELVARGAKTLVLSRNASKLNGVPNGVTALTIDYSDEEGLAKLFKEYLVDVIVSTINLYPITGNEDVQLAVARAAVKAGTVKVFVPTEFGFSSNGRTDAGTDWEIKDSTIKKIQSMGLSTVRIYNGLFMEFIPWMLTTRTHPDKFAIAGKGETKMTFTALNDIAGFTAEILTSLPFSELDNITVPLEGEAATLLDVSALLKKEVVFVEADALDNSHKIIIQALVERGEGRTGFDVLEKPSLELIEERSGSGNRLWKGHVWKKIEEMRDAIHPITYT
ncbi:hypothetical protein DL96DRAFT_666591 [Flagelloscypha sp. PMI_526]|nr:hypothetical protein DL96DRAFT_666591 [Flagelloscypha sp. PMI_526]